MEDRCWTSTPGPATAPAVSRLCSTKHARRRPHALAAAALRVAVVCITSPSDAFAAVTLSWKRHRLSTLRWSTL
jgi:hypothetical protein